MNRFIEWDGDVKNEEELATGEAIVNAALDYLEKNAKWL